MWIYSHNIREWNKLIWDENILSNLVFEIVQAKINFNLSQICTKHCDCYNNLHDARLYTYVANVSYERQSVCVITNNICLGFRTGLEHGICILVAASCLNLGVMCRGGIAVGCVAHMMPLLRNLLSQSVPTAGWTYNLFPYNPTGIGFVTKTYVDIRTLMYVNVSFILQHLLFSS